MNNSIALMAPHSSPQTTIVLPNPKLSDDTALANKVQLKEALDGSITTYIQRTDRRIFKLSFELTQEKDEELRRFFDAYVAVPWRYYRTDNTVWIVHTATPEYASITVGKDEAKEATLLLEGSRLS